MKTSYSRRELYALGEPIGESSTYELAGRRVYGGGGGIVGDIVGGVGDIVGGAVDTVGDLGQGAIDTVKENPELAAAAAMYFGMPSGFEGFGGAAELGGWDAAMADLAGSSGLGNFVAPAVVPELGGWDAAMADLAGGAGADSGIIGLGDAGAWDAATSGAYGGPASAGTGFGSQVARMLGKSLTGEPGGLTLGGGLLGGAGIAGLMNMIKKDNERYGTPGRRDMMSPMNQFNYNPAMFSAPKVDPAAFRPVGVPTAKVGYADGGAIEAMSNANAIGANTGYPQADIIGHSYSTPWQTPVSQNVVTGSADTGVDRMTGQMFAEGGVTGSGNLNLNIPLNLGGQSGPNEAYGYKAAGSGDGSSFNAPSVSGGMFSQAGAGGFGQPMDSRMMQGGFDPRAISSNPQGFQQMMQMAQQRERYMPGSTFLSQAGGMGIGGLFGGQPIGRPSYEQYVAGRNPMQQDVQMTRDQYNSANPAQQVLPARFMAGGGISSLGGYSDGGRMLKGPGDGMSDSIPASISGKQPARLADGEFVVPADVVSHLGNGSTDAGAKQLYKMMDKVRSARTGRKAQGRQINPKKYMPA